MSPDGRDRRVNVDRVRDVRFVRTAGYDAAQVDDLIRRIAVELDAGRPAGPLITNARFGLGPGYEMDAVDWFLEQLRRPDNLGPSGSDGADPWRDLPIGNQFTGSVSADPGERVVAAGLVARQRQGNLDSRHLAEQCASAWRDFAQLPGTHLRWIRAGRGRYELRTAEQEAITSISYGRGITVSAGGRTFTWRRVTGSSVPGITEIIARAPRGRPAQLPRRRSASQPETSESSPAGDAAPGCSRRIGRTYR